MKKLIIYFSAIVLLVFATLAQSSEDQLISTYLTFQQIKTSDNMTVNALLDGKVESASLLFNDSPFAEPSDSSSEIIMSRNHIRKVDRTVVSVEIFDLQPNTTYFYKLKLNDQLLDQQYSFTTLPDDDSPIRFLTGGDMGYTKDIASIGASGKSKNPHVILIGGDIAYANGKSRDFGRWDKWFTFMNEVMVDEEGHITPLIMAIGNHEMKKSFLGRSKAPFFFHLFPQRGEQAYFFNELGNHTLLITLDSGNVHKWDRQAEWMQNNMDYILSFKNKMAIYHHPLYPSHRDFSFSQAAAGREHWGPVFDEMSLNVAFENHDHTFKRTKPLYNNQVDGRGTIYLGDGCWGKGSRTSKDRWYLEKHAGVKHLWYGNVSADELEFMALGEPGVIYDHFTLNN